MNEVYNPIRLAPELFPPETALLIRFSFIVLNSLPYDKVDPGDPRPQIPKHFMSWDMLYLLPALLMEAPDFLFSPAQVTPYIQMCRSLPGMNTVHLNHSSVTDDHVKYLFDGVSVLQSDEVIELCCQGCHRLTDVGIRLFAQNFRILRVLRLHNEHVTEDTAVELIRGSHATLRDVTISSRGSSKKSIQALSMCEHLTTLSLSHLSRSLETVVAFEAMVTQCLELRTLTMGGPIPQKALRVLLSRHVQEIMVEQRQTPFEDDIRKLVDTMVPTWGTTVVKKDVQRAMNNRLVDIQRASVGSLSNVILKQLKSSSEFRRSNSSDKTRGGTVRPLPTLGVRSPGGGEFPPLVK
eukprot:PhF_6_TR30707/c0_g1_i2/m.45183